MDELLTLSFINRPQKAGFFVSMNINKAAKLKELEKKLAEVEEKHKFKMSHFRGVPHESASGELAYSELKVLEDFIESLKSEIAILKGTGGPKVLDEDAV